jgi:hypothetical protein
MRPAHRWEVTDRSYRAQAYIGVLIDDLVPKERLSRIACLLPGRSIGCCSGKTTPIYDFRNWV